MELTRGSVELLEAFQPVFTMPSFGLFVDLMTGWVLSHRHRYVTDLILTCAAVGKCHFSNYRRLFSQYVWESDALSWVLARLLVAMFAPTGTIYRAIDDTPCRKRGLTVYGTGRPIGQARTTSQKGETSPRHGRVGQQPPAVGDAPVRSVRLSCHRDASFRVVGRIFTHFHSLDLKGSSPSRSARWMYGKRRSSC